MTNTALSSVHIRKISPGETLEAEDQLAVEDPLEIQLFYGPAGCRVLKNISVTMRTPGSDRELALGFLFTEGIIQRAGQVAGIWHAGTYTPMGNVGAPEAPANALRVDLHEDAEPVLPSADRNFYTTSSCGVCGKASIDAITTISMYGKHGDPFRVPADLFYGLLDQLRNKQTLFKHTGGIHASAFFDREGRLLLLREDVGRHNALDKLIGAAMLVGMLPLDKGILLLSGRASFELIQKAVMAGIKMVVAVGAPSSLAVELARENGITLAGFLRNQCFNIYSGQERIEL